MRYSGIHPHYFPRLHYFARILQADIYVTRDDAQYVKKHKYPGGRVDKSYQADTPIKGAMGRFLLSIPIKHGGYLPLGKTHISYESRWIGDHLKALTMSYAKAVNFRATYKEIGTILARKYTILGNLNLATIFWGILRLLGDSAPSREISLREINKLLEKQNTFRLKEIRRSSDSAFLKKETDISPNEKIIGLIREVGANEDYCGGTAATAYMDADLFSRHGITLTVQDWKCRQYPQLFMKKQSFIPNVSIIDLLMNTSRRDAIRILNG